MSTFRDASVHRFLLVLAGVGILATSSLGASPPSRSFLPSECDGLWSMRWFGCDCGHDNVYQLNRDGTPICGSGNCPGGPGTCWGPPVAQLQYAGGGISWIISSQGGLVLQHVKDLQVYGSVYLFALAPVVIHAPWSADVGRVWLNDAEVTPSSPLSLYMTAGWNHLEFTSYNQNQDTGISLNYPFLNDVAGVSSSPNVDCELGACCHSDGTCSVVARAQCQPPTGDYVGGACEPNPCPSPTGACCNTAAGFPACTITTEAACQPLNLTWLGAATQCSAQTCVPTGNCCDHAIPACTVTTEAACLASGFEWLGTSPCDVQTICLPPTGSCCYPDGTCLELTETECINEPTHTKIGAAWGVWTKGGTCTPNICVQPSGSCCTRGGKCTVTVPADCAVTSTWTPEGVCVPNTCQVPETGSCCFRNSYCMIFTPARCAALRGTWVGDAACAPSANPRCLVLPSMDSDPSLDQSAPSQRKDSWGQIKNRYR
jgi:hypothetical protein